MLRGSVKLISDVFLFVKFFAFHFALFLVFLFVLTNSLCLRFSPAVTCFIALDILILSIPIAIGLSNVFRVEE